MKCVALEPRKPVSEYRFHLTKSAAEQTLHALTGPFSIYNTFFPTVLAKHVTYVLTSKNCKSFIIA